MVRVLHIAGNLVKGGGIESFLMGIYSKLDKNLVQFDFLSTNPVSKGETYQNAVEQMGGRFYKLSLSKYNFAKRRRELSKWIMNHPEYKIVHFHVSSLFRIDDMVTMKKCGVKTICVHAHNSKQTGKKVLDFLHYFNKLRIIKIADYFFGCSNMANTYMYPSTIVNSNRARVINNGIDLQKYRYDYDARYRKRQELMLGDKIVIGCVARIAPQKNQIFTIDIFNEFQKKYPNSVLLFVGHENASEYAKNVRCHVEMLDLQSKIIFLGMRTDVNELYNAMDLYLHPALFEGFGISIVEAQATGLPCLISRNVIPDNVKITDIIRDVSLDSDIKIWIEQMEILLKTSRTDKTEMIKNAGFDIEDTAAEMQQFYLELNNIE